ncbi:DedA family protein [candidate division KSB1 bacterium]|nr:DedA family protein [candidate division KSB1 bacterium]
MIRRLYDWVLHWAETPYGMWALFLIAFAESSFFPIPPDVLLIALAISIPTRAFHFALVATIGSLIGGIAGYGIGMFGYDSIGRPIVEFYHGQEIMQAIKEWYDKYGFWAVLGAAITPLPYKIFTISSGMFSFDFFQFMIASIIGRSVRFFAVAGLIWKFGKPIKGFIDKYFNLLATLFIILLIGGFIIIKYLL